MPFQPIRMHQKTVATRSLSFLGADQEDCGLWGQVFDMLVFHFPPAQGPRSTLKSGGAPRCLLHDAEVALL